MKLKVLAWVIPMALMVFSCGEKKKDEQFVIFSGQIKNATFDSIYIKLNNREKGFALDFDGNFSDTVQLPFEGYKTLAIDREEFPIYLIQGDSLSLHVDLKDIETTYFFRGVGAERNNYLFEKDLLVNQWMANDKVFRLDENEYRNNITDFSMQLRELLKEVKPEKSFDKIEHRNIYFDEFNLLYVYRDSFAYFNPTKPQLPVDFLNFKKFNLDNELNFNQFESYRTIVTYYLDEQLNRGVSPSTILAEIKSENIRNSFIRSLIDNLDPKDESSYAAYEAIQKYCTYKPWIAEANEIMDKKR